MSNRSKRTVREEHVRLAGEEPAGLYKTLVGTVPAGVILEEPSGNAVYANEEAARITGYSVEELRNGVWMGHPDETEGRAIYENALKHGTAGTNYEMRLVRKDGRVIWVSVSWRPAFDDSGRLIYLYTMFTEITEHKRTEKALEEAEERYRLLAENASDILWQMDAQGTFTYMSQAIRQSGYEPEEWVGHQPTDFLAEEDKHVFLSTFFEDLRSPGPKRYEVRVHRKDGSLAWLEIVVDFVLVNGIPVKVQGIARDITERKQAEEALLESEERYKSIVENSSDLIMLTQPDGTVSYLSPACEDMLGYEPAELVGQKPWIVHPDDSDRATQAFERAMAGQRGMNLEERIITKSGEVRWVSHSWSPVFAEDGSLRMVASVVRDITQRKQSEEALRKAHSDLERAYELQREFLNNVTHEVRTPLTAIHGYARMFLEGLVGPVSAEQASVLRKMLSCSDHLLETVGGVLEIARLKSGMILLRPKVCSPCQVVDKVVSVILPEARQKGLAVNVNFPGKDTTGLYDREKLITILSNLLSNAVKFTQKGEIEVTVDCGASGAEVVIADPGVGISQSDLPSIFDEFRQLDSPGRRKPAGFGIGLAIVASMVDTIGASLTVSSRKGVGTAFTLEVPTLDVQQPARPRGRKPPARRHRTPRKGGL